MVLRCPDCGAGSPESAQWCTLCFADLRPAPAPPPAPPPALARTAESFDPLTDPLPDTGTTATIVAAAPAVDPLAAVATWPCRGCGADVAISLDTCDACGAGFLTGSIPEVSVRIPGVGDLRRLTRGQRAGLAVVLALAIMLALVMLATILGTVF